MDDRGRWRGQGRWDSWQVWVTRTRQFGVSCEIVLTTMDEAVGNRGRCSWDSHAKSCGLQWMRQLGTKADAVGTLLASAGDKDEAVGTLSTSADDKDEAVSHTPTEFRRKQVTKIRILRDNSHLSESDRCEFLLILGPWSSQDTKGHAATTAA